MSVGILKTKEDEIAAALLVQEDVIGSAYGVFLTLDEVVITKYLDSVQAEHKVEIAIKIDDCVKEFTISEFKKKLGFED